MARRMMARRRRVHRIDEAEADRLLGRAKSWANYGFAFFVDRPVTRAEIDAMRLRELRALVTKYRNEMAGPTARNTVAILDEIEAC